MVITKMSAYTWLLWYIMTVNISVVGIRNGVPVLTDEIDSSRHCIHNSNNVWHILHYLFRKGIYYHPYYLFWHWFISFRYCTAHCKLFAEVTVIQTFNGGITSKYIWISGILRIMLCLYCLQFTNYGYYCYLTSS